MSRELTRLSVMAGVTPGGRAVCLPPVAPPPPPQGLLAREPSCRCHSPCRRQLITATTKLPTCCHAIHKTAMRRPLPPPSHSHDFYLSSSQLCLGPQKIYPLPANRTHQSSLSCGLRCGHTAAHFLCLHYRNTVKGYYTEILNYSVLASINDKTCQTT